MRPLIESGKLRPLVIFSEERLPVLKDVPTAKEIGADITLGRWRGFAFKEGTKKEFIDSMEKIFEKAVQNNLYKTIEAQNMLQFRSKFLGPEQFRAFFESQKEIYGSVLKKLGYIK